MQVVYHYFIHHQISYSDGSNHRSLQGKSPSLAEFKSFIFIYLPCFPLQLVKNQAITWPPFLLQTFAWCHLVPHVILHQMVLFSLRNNKRWPPDRLKRQFISRRGATFSCKDCFAGVIHLEVKLDI